MLNSWLRFATNTTIDSYFLFKKTIDPKSRFSDMLCLIRKEVRIMIGFYDYTVLLTYSNALLGVLAIYSTLNNNIFLGILCLLFAGICDSLDGMVANLKEDRNEQEISFGIQIDSFADIISFCVYPTILGYQLGYTSFLALIIFCFYILTGIIRLAYFNVTENIRKSSSNLPRTFYEGLPVTSASFIFPIVVGLFCREYIYLFIMAFMGVLFISKFRIKKMVFLSSKKKLSK